MDIHINICIYTYMYIFSNIFLSDLRVVFHPGAEYTIAQLPLYHPVRLEATHTGDFLRGLVEISQQEHSCSQERPQRFRGLGHHLVQIIIRGVRSCAATVFVFNLFILEA